MAECSSYSDCDDLLERSWSVNKRKIMWMKSNASKPEDNCDQGSPDKLAAQSEKFEQLKAKSAEIMLKSSIRRQKTEVRRSRKLLKKVMKDPWIKATVEGRSFDSDESERDNTMNWKDVKPYLSVNDHLQGPVSHGDCGPKTELECKIEDCIKEGDFEKAELLSDTLANREFAVKIAQAFRAKRCSEELEKQKLEEKRKQMKKIRWTFEAKERWQMKGNM